MTLKINAICSEESNVKSSQKSLLILLESESDPGLELRPLNRDLIMMTYLI